MKAAVCIYRGTNKTDCTVAKTNILNDPKSD